MKEAGGEGGGGTSYAGLPKTKLKIHNSQELLKSVAAASEVFKYGLGYEIFIVV